jgi:hypothetical protein
MSVTDKVARAISEAIEGQDVMVQREDGDVNEEAMPALASAAINAMPTTFTGPWVKALGPDGSTLLTHMSEDDYNVTFKISAEDVKKLFG